MNDRTARSVDTSRMPQVNPTPVGRARHLPPRRRHGLRRGERLVPGGIALRDGPLYNSLRIANGFPSNFILEIARAVAAPAPPPSGAKLDSIASANLARDRTVGAFVGIVKGADTLFLAVYGKANVESDAPMRTDAIFRIGFSTKQFTAAAILQSSGICHGAPNLPRRAPPRTPLPDFVA